MVERIVTDLISGFIVCFAVYAIYVHVLTYNLPINEYPKNASHNVSFHN